MNRYIAIDHENSKYYKDVPYITKKEFKEKDNPVILGKTKLKEYKSESDKEVDLLCFNDEQYEVKEKVFGFRKGYVDVGDNNYILLKKRIPFLFLLFFLLLLLLFLFFLFRTEKKIEEESPKVPTPIQEEIKIPDDTSKEESKPSKKEEVNKPKPSKQKPTIEEKIITYEIVFDANGGNGDMDSIVCEINNNCKLPKGIFTKEGYTFAGWSEDPKGKVKYENETEVYNISPNEKITLYAMWKVNAYNITFLDYDDSIIKEDKYDFGEKIIEPEEPKRKGYNFAGWDNDLDIVKESTTFKATYKVNTYDISYDLNGGILVDAPSNYDVENDLLKIPHPEKEGYNFLGWSSEDNDKPIKDYEIPTGTIGNIELTANYEPKIYNLIFNTNGATEKVSPKKIKYDSTFGELPLVTKKGYTFINWVDKENNEVSSKTIFKETNDITIKAIWETISYEIKYNLVGGKIENNPTNYNVESDSIVLPNPTKEGYIFVGWSIPGDNNTFIKDYEIPTGTTGNIELTANYSPISYYISYNSQGAEGTMENTKVKYNNTALLSKNVFEKEGYVFKGWAIEPDGDVIYNDKSEVYNLASEEGAIFNLYAKWEIIKLEVKYIDLFGVILKKETVEYGSKPNYPEDPFIEGYTFVGWDSKTTGLIKNDTTYKAKYSINNYDIIYDLNKGQENDKTIIRYNIETQSITLPNPTRTGYKFIGWTGSNGLNPQKDITIIKGTLGNKNYKANWTANIYNVTLNPNKGTVTPKSISISYDSLYGILPIPERIGYSFEGWYSDQNKILDSTIMKKTSDHELTANWKVINYDISYDLRGGSLSSTISNYNIESETFTLPTPIRTGYKFIGWTGSNGTTPSKNVVIPKGSYGNKDYVANWETIDYSINYNLNGGSLSSSISNYNIESETFTLPTPIRTGYKFIGWTGSNGTTPSKNVVIPKGSYGNKDYVANWETIDYSINYNLNGGSLSSPISNYNIETNSFTLPTPTREGYTFIGWTGSNGTTPSKNVVIPKGSYGNKDYVANWETINYSISYNLDGGSASSLVTQYNIETNSFTLPIPTKTGYTFVGWTGTGLNSATKNVSINKGSMNNRNYTATWSKNYYTVNYYMNDNLWATRSVGYNDSLENLNGQSALDGYHTFHGWTGWVDRMPDHNVDLHANITEAYCNLMTGHGEYGNASGLLNVFQSAGWTGHIEESPYFPGNFMVVTDYNLTRYQAEVQKNYIAAHTNYTNYNFPYLYWVAVSCTNGYSEAWTRPVGQSSFN